MSEDLESVADAILRAAQPCCWVRRSGDEHYETACGEGYLFNMCGNLDRPRGFDWCPYCGHKIKSWEESF